MTAKKKSTTKKPRAKSASRKKKRDVGVLGRRVRRWLSEEGFFREDVKDEKARFHFRVSFPPGSPFVSHVVQPLDRKDMVIVLSGVRVGANHARVLAASPALAEDVLWELRYQLIGRPTEFDLRVRDGRVTSCLVQDIIYADGLTKNRLVMALREVFKSKLLFMWVLKKKLDKLKPPKSDTGRMYA